MKAVVYQEPLSVAIENVNKPRIEYSRDVIIKLTTSAICGSDLHMYGGHTTFKQGGVFGHEPMGVIGVYVNNDPKARNEMERYGHLNLPWAKIWNKGITLGMGQTPVKQFHVLLRNMIVADVAKPSFIITDRIKIDQAPDVYREFEKRDDVVKPVIKFT